jgi:hypothetical protein
MPLVRAVPPVSCAGAGDSSTESSLWVVLVGVLKACVAHSSELRAMRASIRTFCNYG